MRNLVALAAVLLTLSTTVQAQERASLGVTMSEQPGVGVLVTEVAPVSPAATIGLQPGDRILAIDNQPMTNYQDVIRAIAAAKPQTRIELKVARGVWQATVPVSLVNATEVVRTQPLLAPATVPAAPAAYAYPRYPTPNYNYTPADIDDQHAFGG
jgi:C-terminal processing protease CtpA/Prc